MEHKSGHTNHLVGEASLYLRQHAGQPVEWYAWGPAAFERARAEDKPILLSIGYSSCHWCHVMAHESFDDPETARLMNESFVNIKVDREERPDLDEVYMTAVQAMTGQGGWPMTVFMTPEGRPFYAGSYFPPQDRYGMPGFRRLLTYLAQQYRARRPEIERIGAEVAHNIHALAQAEWAAGELKPALLESVTSQMLDQYDEVHGGFGGAPKFPQAMAVQFLLRAGVTDVGALAAARHTLDQMAAGGMYDWAGGGFHRYSVDAKWLVPHFEKMLYDNALLALAYLDGYRLTGEERYRGVVVETCDYLLREMRLAGGGFAAAQDADTSEGEGRFFAWRAAEFREVVGPADADWAAAFLGMTEAGNFEHGLNLLRQSLPRDALAQRLGCEPAEAEARVGAIRERLLAARNRRPAPARDDKALADWNGLAIRALAAAGEGLGRPDYVLAAEAAADFILGTMRDADGRLMHGYAEGRASGPGFLNDYADVIAGLIALHQATLETRWLRVADALTERAVALFWDEQGGGFFFTDQEHVIPMTRPKKVVDQPTPAGNSMMAQNLLLLDALLGRPAYASLAERTLRRFAAALERSGLALAQMALALDQYARGTEVVTVVGRREDGAVAEMLRVARAGFAPRRLVVHAEGAAGGKALVQGKPATYVCRGRICLAPLTETDALAATLDATTPPTC